MIVAHFILWCETASVESRRRGLAIMVKAWAGGLLTREEREEANEAFLFFLQDPSDKVRRTLAETLAPHGDAPLALVLGLCEDIEPIAVLAANLSPRLGEGHLVHLAATRSPAVQAAIAARPGLPGGAIRQIAETGAREACLALLANASIRPDESSLDRLAERFAADGVLRAALVTQPRLSPATRQSLVRRHAEVLASAGFVRAALGTARATRVAAAAAERAEVSIARQAAMAGGSARFVEHLRRTGQLTEAFLFRALFDGNVDVFAAALALLSGISDKRVRSVLVEARERPLASLLAASGLSAAGLPVVRSALASWQRAAQAGAVQSPGAVRGRIVAEALEAASAAGRGQAEGRDLVALLAHIAAEARREDVRARVGRRAAA